MKKAIGILCLSVIMCSQSFSQCISDTNNIYSFFFDNDQYEIVKENKTWVDAAACAVERGGKLSEITSQLQQDAIYLEVANAGISAGYTVAPDGGGASYLWLGGHDKTTEGTWIWDGMNNGTGINFWQGVYGSGSVIGGMYNNWGMEPDDYNGQDGLGLAITNWPLGVAGEWNDVDETNQLYFIIQIPTTSLFIQQSMQFNIFPNPASDKLNIQIKGNNLNHQIFITNIIGKQVYESDLFNSFIEIKLQDFHKGVYLLMIKNELGQKESRKIVIK